MWTTVLFSQVIYSKRSDFPMITDSLSYQEIDRIICKIQTVLKNHHINFFCLNLTFNCLRRRGLQPLLAKLNLMIGSIGVLNHNFGIFVIYTHIWSDWEQHMKLINLQGVQWDTDSGSKKHMRAVENGISHDLTEAHQSNKINWKWYFPLHWHIPWPLDEGKIIFVIVISSYNYNKCQVPKMPIEKRCHLIRPRTNRNPTSPKWPKSRPPK